MGTHLGLRKQTQGPKTIRLLCTAAPWRQGPRRCRAPEHPHREGPPIALLLLPLAPLWSPTRCALNKGRVTFREERMAHHPYWTDGWGVRMEDRRSGVAPPPWTEWGLAASVGFHF